MEMGVYRHQWSMTTRLIETCKEHGKELDLFCKGVGCYVAICSRCLLLKHKTHEVIEIEEEKKVELKENIFSVQRNLQAKIRQIYTVKRDN